MLTTNRIITRKLENLNSRQRDVLCQCLSIGWTASDPIIKHAVKTHLFYFGQAGLNRVLFRVSHRLNYTLNISDIRG